MADWPERFIYVCNATQASIVNMLPLVHSGFPRVRHIEIFCGAPSLSSRDVRYEREAIAPAKRLEQLATKWGRNAGNVPSVNLRFGDPERVDVWARHMSAVCEDAAKRNLPVVYNLTGGRKAMAIGGLLGHDPEGARFIMVRGAPTCCELLSGLDQLKLRRNGELTLEQYLTLYGLSETAPKASKEKAAFFEQHRKEIEKLSEKIMSNEGVYSALNEATAHLEERGRYKSGEISLVPGGHRSAWENRGRLHAFEAVAALDGVAGFRMARKARGGEATVGAQVVQLLRGGWLEAAALFAIKRALHGRNDADIRSNVSLHFSGDRGNQTADMGELDVAIMIGSQLYAIEAKTGAFGAKAARSTNQQSFEKVESLKRILQGQFGGYFIVNPRISPEKLPSVFAEKAAAAGIELFLGDRALDDLAARISAIRA